MFRQELSLGIVRIAIQVLAAVAAWMLYVTFANLGFIVLPLSVLLVWLVVALVDWYRSRQYRDLIAWSAARAKRSYRLIARIWGLVTISPVIPLVALVYLEGNFVAVVLSYLLPLQWGVLQEVSLLALSKHRIQRRSLT